MADLEPVLSVRDLTVAFRSRGAWTEVVHGVSFDVAAGETVALVGESGSGKSVSAMSLVRLLPARQSRVGGSVTIAGTDVGTLSQRRLADLRGRDVGVVFQEPMTSLNPVYTVATQIGETLRRHRGLSRGEARVETRRLLDLVRIPDAARRLDQYPHELSGGMRQRVMIAMALACRPKLLIADEPTTALDVTVQAQILDLLASLQAELGVATVFITHDLGVVAEIADRVLVMKQGEIVERGATADVFERPQHAYTRMLLGAIPVLGSMAGKPPPGRPDTAAPPLLTVEGLTVRFPIHGGTFGRTVADVHAVENVSFDLARGETLAIVGESGCGKSTTGRAVLRLTEPSTGRVAFDGVDVGGLSGEPLRAMRRRMQMIFQDPFGSLNPRMPVGLAISEPMRLHGLASGAALQERTAELMRRVGLDPAWTSRYPHQFSGGQRQRIAIARALGLEPQLIVADEAVSALDVSVKGQIVDLLTELQETLGLSYLFISHDMAIVERMSHRVAVMYLGQIVEIGPRAAVFEDPQHPYTRKLLAAVPVADPRRRPQRGMVVADELRTPVFARGTERREPALVEVAPGHLIRAAA